jgi:hypothetical protein
VHQDGGELDILTVTCISGWIEMTNLLGSDFQETSADLLINTLQTERVIFFYRSVKIS